MKDGTRLFTGFLPLAVLTVAAVSTWIAFLTGSVPA